MYIYVYLYILYFLRIKTRIQHQKKIIIFYELFLYFIIHDIHMASYHY